MDLQSPKQLGKCFLGTTVLFSVCVSLGTSVALLVSSCFGYLPYSDRPGPGWWGHSHFPSGGELATYFGFAPFFAYFCCILGLGIFGLSLVLSFASAPRWLSRTLGSIFSGAAALLAVAGAGWYMALAPIGPDIAGGFGLLYGAVLFPRFVYPRSKPFPIVLRASVIVLASGLFAFWLAYPFLPRTPAPQISYDLIRVTPGSDPVTAPEWQGMDVARELAELNLRGRTHGGIGGPSASTEAAPEIHVELIALEPITAQAKLAIPKQGYVVYVLKDRQWTAHPSIQKADKHVLTVLPGSDAKYDGGKVQFTGGEQFAFTWYPVIAKGT